jgi:hypothetical protein
VITSFFDGLLSSHQTLLLTVIPLWLVADTDAPRVLLAWLFATNTIGAVLFQVPVSRTVTGLKTALRAEARAAAFMVASCLIILVTDHTIWLTIPLIWLAHATVTGVELFESSASWSLHRLADHRGHRRGRRRGNPPLGPDGPALPGRRPHRSPNRSRPQPNNARPARDTCSRPSSACPGRGGL